MSKEAKILIAVGAVIAVGVSALILVGAKDKAEVKPESGGDNIVREDSYQTNKGAAVTVVEFGDYQCPACKSAQPTINQIKSEFGPRINFVFRHLPLSQHKNARVSAEAAEAAGAQGKFWEMTDLLYENQSQWANQSNPINTFVTYAGQLGLNVDQFRTDVENERYKDKIQRDFDDAQALKINSTPTFFVNGTLVEDVAQLRAAIQNALQTAAPVAP